MLVLSRKDGERIMIGDDIVITVVEIRRDGKVRIGIEAPDHVRVDREEVRRAIDRARLDRIDSFEEGGAA